MLEEGIDNDRHDGGEARNRQARLKDHPVVDARTARDGVSVRSCSHRRMLNIVERSRKRLPGSSSTMVRWS
jgi:hypothetical protein